MSTDDPIAEPQKERPPGAPQEPAPEAEKPPPLLRNTDRSKLPAAKREQWSLRPATWAEYSEEERKRWREWFDWAVSEDGELWDAHAKRANLVGAQLEGADLSRAHLKGADLFGAHLKGADLTWASLEGADLRVAYLEGAHLAGTDLTGADLFWANLERANLFGAHLDNKTELAHAVLDGALLKQVDMTRVDLKDASLFGAKIVEPEWSPGWPRARFHWTKLPKIVKPRNWRLNWLQAWLFRTEFPERIPEHPIQDVQGLPPGLRRDIADLQYLRELHERFSSKLWRSLIWVWGLSCGYGRSLWRWALCSLVVVAFFTLVFCGLRFNIEAHHSEWVAIDRQQVVSQLDRPGWGRALYFSVVTFTTLGLGDITPVTGWGQFWVAAEVFIGYAMLGVLISILALKIARLS